MKIISKFHDCYDSVLKMGTEESIVYIRHTKEIDDINVLTYINDTFFNNVPYQIQHVNYSDHFKPIFFFFCGYVYLAYKFEFRPNLGEEISKTLYTYDKIEETLKQYKLKWPQKSKYYNLKYKWNRTYFYKKFVQKAFVTYNRKKISTDLNIKYNSPVLVSYKEKNDVKLIVNPKLYEYQFLNKFDPYTLFQEIQMYVGGVLGNTEKNIVEVSDKTKISQHGYDKWSFRKMPENKGK